MMFDVSSHVPPKAIWNDAVAARPAAAIRDLWQPRAPIEPSARFVTAGSEFAHHLRAELEGRGFNWLNAEAAPGSPLLQQAYHYGEFSFRTGPILTARMLRQWLTWSRNHEACPALLWQQGGRFYDPFRPDVEFEGFESREEALASRRITLLAVRAAIRHADVLVVTLSQTEGWRVADSNIEISGAPPVGAAGMTAVSPGFEAVRDDLNQIIGHVRRLNRSARLIFTLSACPAEAALTGQHALAANGQGKAILRAAMASLSDHHDWIEYFPAYEVLTLPGTPHGAGDMANVMQLFFDGVAKTRAPGADGDQPDLAGAK